MKGGGGGEILGYLAWNVDEYLKDFRQAYAYDKKSNTPNLANLPKEYFQPSEEEESAHLLNLLFFTRVSSSVMT